MASNKETRPDQLTFSTLLNGIDRIPTLEKQKNPPIIPLSQTKLELLTPYLFDPQLPVKDPRNVTLPQHLRIVLGIALHQIVQTTQIWHAILPADSQNYQEKYYENLKKATTFLATNHRLKQARLLRYLADPRLPFVRRRGDTFHQATHSIYNIIAQLILADMKHEPPFTDTPAFPLFAHNPNLTTLIPFPDPATFNHAWNNSEGPDSPNPEIDLYRQVSTLCDYQEDQGISPFDFGRHYHGYQSELAFSSFIHRPFLALWSGRLDARTIGVDPSGCQVTTIYDYKSGPLTQELTNSTGSNFTRLAIFMTVLAALGIPQHLEDTARTYREKLSFQTLAPDQQVKVRYISFAESEPQMIDFSDHWERDWRDERQAQQLTDLFGDIVSTLRHHQTRFRPILGIRSEDDQSTQTKLAQWTSQATSVQTDNIDLIP